MPLLTTDEMASLLKVKPETLKGWVRRGLVPAIRITQKVLRFDATEVERVIRERQTGGDDA